jgi:uncharacterized protein (DUF2147 family)
MNRIPLQSVVVTTSRLLATVSALVISAMPGTAATNADIFGTWIREDGAARVRIAICGDAICATNLWIKNPERQNEKVGDRLVFKIMPKEAEWVGSAYDPQRNLNLSAKLKVTGNSMVSTGCVMASLLCKSTKWTRM